MGFRIYGLGLEFRALGLCLEGMELLSFHGCRLGIQGYMVLGFLVEGT